MIWIILLYSSLVIAIQGILLLIPSKIFLEKWYKCEEGKTDKEKYWQKSQKLEKLFNSFLLTGICLCLISLVGTTFATNIQEPLLVNKEIVSENVIDETPLVKEGTTLYYFGKTDKEIYYVENGALQSIKNENVIGKKSNSKKSIIKKIKTSHMPNTVEYLLVPPKTVYEITSPDIFEYEKGISKSEILEMARSINQ